MKKVTLGLFLALSAAGAMAQQNSNMTGGMTTMVGKMNEAEFARKNKMGAEQVAAIQPNAAQLNKTDSDLMMKVAMGGMMQLETSRIAVQKATNPEVKELAQAEVDEQTGLSAKLKEIATAKGITLPATPDADTQKMMTMMDNMTAGADFDRHYVREHGVKGHQKLDKVMSMVKSKGKDDNLSAVAKAAHPLVKTHLMVSEDLLRKLSSANGSMNSGR
jgi:putative membrane protein